MRVCFLCEQAQNRNRFFWSSLRWGEVGVGKRRRTPKGDLRQHNFSDFVFFGEGERCELTFFSPDCLSKNSWPAARWGCGSENSTAPCVDHNFPLSESLGKILAKRCSVIFLPACLSGCSVCNGYVCVCREGHRSVCVCVPCCWV